MSLVLIQNTHVYIGTKQWYNGSFYRLAPLTLPINNFRVFSVTVLKTSLNKYFVC